MTKSNTVDQNPFTAFTKFGGQPYETMQKSYQHVARMAGGMTALNRETASAMRESAQIASKSYMAMNVRTMEFARQMANSWAEASSKMKAAKSVRDIVDAELSCARTLLSEGLEEMTAVTGLFLETANKNTELVSTHAGKMVESLRDYS